MNQKILQASEDMEPWFLSHLPEWEGKNFLVLGDHHMGYAFSQDEVVFYYLPLKDQPPPKRVVAAGDYQGWNPNSPVVGVLHPLKGREIWTYEISDFTPSLDPGYDRILYKFVVDGEWINRGPKIFGELELTIDD